MKKLLSLVVLAGAICFVGCEDKKTSPPAGGGAKSSGAVPSTGAPSATTK